MLYIIDDKNVVLFKLLKEFGLLLIREIFKIIGFNRQIQ